MPQTKSKLNSFHLPASQGSVVAITISKPEETLINRYASVFDTEDLRSFVRHSVTSTIRWMQRMINGPDLFELATMDNWKFNEETELLTLKTHGSKRLRDYSVVYDVSFCHGNIEEYHLGLAEILSSYWYKKHAVPASVVELIACCDLLYRRYHNGISPASAAGVQHTDVDVNARSFLK